MAEKTHVTIDEYLADYDGVKRQMMDKLRAIIKEGAPEATEKISWGMPTFFQKKNLVHFAAAKNHIGFYPGPETIEAFLPKLEGYKTSKGAIQLPITEPLPEKLIREMVDFQLKRIVG